MFKFVLRTVPADDLAPVARIVRINVEFYLHIRQGKHPLLLPLSCFTNVYELKIEI